MPQNEDAVPGRLYARHSLPVRAMHWINVAAVLVLVMSGLQIFNAHPALYWGESSYTGAGPIWAPGRFPGWITLPGTQWLSMGRRWHFFFAWVFVLNGAAYVAYAIASRHLARDLWPARGEWPTIGRSIREHLRLRHPAGVEAARYNVLQKLAYVGVVFVVLPLLVLMGLGMSPTFDAWVPGWIELFGGRQSARTLHFASAAVLVAFVAVHLFEVVVTGAWNNVRSMVTGRYRIPAERPR
jgi:thiosulfate reductase cytochrome b subunit